MVYLLDSNVFIQAKNLHYKMDFCPAFWDWLLKENNNSNVFSIEKVYDELSIWAEDLLGTFFLNPDDAMAKVLPSVSGWVYNQKYSPHEIAKFLSTADYYLIAHALAHNFIVVTHEVRIPEPAKKVKIPNVCYGLNVKCISLFEMLSKEKARFVLG